MNRYFDPALQTSEIPKRVYARLDHVEPADGGTDQDTLFAFEAVDASWQEFEEGGQFPLDEDFSLFRRRRRSIFNGAWRGFVKSSWGVYAKAPLSRIEVTAKGEAAKALFGLGRSWLEMELEAGAATDGPTVDVYSSLFAASAPAKFVWPPRRTKNSRALYAAFSMGAHRNATSKEIAAAFKNKAEPEELAVFDIGQGSASAVLDVDGKPIFYFDVGCGVHGNKKTAPKTLKFCRCGEPPVILSHWDADHWAGAALDPEMLKLTWIAPRQPLSGPHQIALAANILNHGGSLLLIPTPRTKRKPRFVHLNGRSVLSLQRGTGSDKNGSGIIVTVEKRSIDCAWLLTGDADYGQISSPTSAELVGVVVPHHGATMGASPAPGPGKLAGVRPYLRLIYSFGPGNKHGKTSISHPTVKTVDRHVIAGWDHGAWVAPGRVPGTCKAGGDVRATASNPSSHLKGILVGWKKKVGSKTSCATCGVALDLTQV